MGKNQENIVHPMPRIWQPIIRGKVRDIYSLPEHGDKILMFASDRISIFDFVLPAQVKDKGKILNALTIFWLEDVLKNFIDNSLIAYGKNIDDYLPANLRKNLEIQSRALVVKTVNVLPVECVARGYLTGSGWGSYQKNQTVCGHKLPPGLWNGAKLPYPIFTPTTKSNHGHDEPISVDRVAIQYGPRFERLSLQIYQAAADYALKKGIVIADTKFEFGSDGTLCDEILTPDSSRFWDIHEWQKFQKEQKVPSAFDKQFVREWGKTQGIDKLDPSKKEDVEYVRSLAVPQEILDQTAKLYRHIFWRLTGFKLEQYLVAKDIKVELKRVKVDVILGSLSDARQAKKGLEFLEKLTELKIHIISCHRNPEELRNYAKECDAEIVIAGAGKYAALPGILSALLLNFDKKIPVIGVAFEGKNAEETKAAILAIEQTPGKMIVLDENKKAFRGENGFIGACSLAFFGKLLPPKKENKRAEFNLNLNEIK